MRVLQRYFAVAILRAVFFVLLAFLALFAFFDMISELKDVGRGGYMLQHAFLYVLMGLPGYIYDLLPIAALIGTIYALAQFAAQSEFTVMRVSGMSTRLAGFMLAKIGVVFLVLTFLFGEFIAPVVSEKAESMKLRVQGALISQQFRSGLWAKDVIKQGGVNGEVIGSRFVNAREVAAGGQLKDVALYEFDTDFRLDTLIRAKTADYQGNFTWRLSNVSETRFAKTATNQNISAPDMTKAIFTQSLESKILVSEITPKILSVLFADPNRMSAYGLFTYTKHLAENNQDSGRYNIAFWKKIIYPFAVFVMMALALPFAYLHFRAGGVSLKIFSGIMLGVTFYLLNNLFSHLGLLNTWPAFATAIAPSLFFLLVAVTALWWVERH